MSDPVNCRAPSDTASCAHSCCLHEALVALGNFHQAYNTSQYLSVNKYDPKSIV